MITQQKGESLLSYQVRLCSNKDEYDLSWDDIKDLLNKTSGENFTADKYRKEWQSAMKFSPLLNSPVEADIAIQDIEDKRRELFKERVKLQDQKRELNGLLREQARFEHLRDEIIKAVYAAAEQKPLTPTLTSISSVFNVTGREGVVVFSDWHKGLFAKNYWNNFDDNIFRARVKYLVEKSIEISVVNGIHCLHVFSLGDLVNGLIHVTTRILATEDVISQTMTVAETLAEVIAEYASVFQEIRLYFVRGNHDRVTPNKSDELSQESFADIVEWYLKARLAKIDNVSFVRNMFDPEIAYGEICGFTVMGVHGHRDKTTDVVQNLTLMTGLKPDYVLMGHIHRNFEDEVHGTEIIVNGSLSGVDSYARDIRKTSKPHQKLIIFEKGIGRYATHNIRLDRID